MKSDRMYGALTPGTNKYPPVVAQCISKPPKIFYRGNVDLMASVRSLAVVGSRQETMINRKNLEFALRPIQDLPLTIVSGLAIGLDGLAHTIALDNNLPTIAVLGSSVEPEEVYPRSNRGLAERIITAGGLLISPFPPKTPIKPWNFPVRNQLIAATAQATLVSSAAKKSGALITAKLALEYGKDVFVIPGYVSDTLYEGSNSLLRDGAHPVLSANDILEYFGFHIKNAREYKTDDKDEKKIITALKAQSLTSNELATHLTLPIESLSPVLSKLEVRGWIATSADGKLHLV